MNDILDTSDVFALVKLEASLDAETSRISQEAEEARLVDVEDRETARKESFYLSSEI
jgi:hypothetical protein